MRDSNDLILQRICQKFHKIGESANQQIGESAIYQFIHSCEFGSGKRYFLLADHIRIPLSLK